MKESWRYWGKLEPGKMVFVTPSGRIAIEQDHKYLVEGTPEEKQEIYRRWPGLLPEAEESRRQQPRITGRHIADLKDTIIDLEFVAANNKSVAEALQYANGEKDKMIVALMGDIARQKEDREGFQLTISRLWLSIEQREERIMELKRRKDKFPAVRENVIADLKDTIIKLEFEAVENRGVIVALKTANEVKDEMTDSLMAKFEALQKIKDERDRTVARMTAELINRAEIIDRMVEWERVGKH